ncbi:MAG TPA: DUF4159 domain-containing protein [Chloroflexota bacterium]|nr:DUF4159 domain-containing protein [Chloroflexota bacterium]
MNIEELASFTLQRVTAYDGLAIDAATWTDAHSYHQATQRLHLRALHGWGIISGLRVQPVDPPTRGVIVQPGVALDADGNLIRVPQPVRIALPQPTSGVACVVLRFSETPVDSGSGVPASRVNENFSLLVSEPPLRPTDIEVARVRMSDTAAPIVAAASEWAPGPYQIDQRFRRQLRETPIEAITIGQLILGDDAAAGHYHQGLVNLVRELRLSAPFLVQYLGETRIEQAVGQCDFLYFSGAGAPRLTPREGAQLLAFLRGGGMLFAEPSTQQETQQKEGGRFVASFQRLLADLKHDLEPIGPEHPLFNARHVFAAPPEGLGGSAPILAKDNVFLSPNDYGGCWQGGLPGKPPAREVIRAATEFGVNIAWHAATRAAAAPAGTPSVPRVAEPVG